MVKRGAGVIVNVVGMGGKVASPIHLPGGAANAALFALEMLATQDRDGLLKVEGELAQMGEQVAPGERAPQAPAEEQRSRS